MNNNYHHCCGQNILHVRKIQCKTTNFGCFHGNTANKGFCTVQIGLQNGVIILVLCFATLQNKLATAVHTFVEFFSYLLSYLSDPLLVALAMS